MSFDGDWKVTISTPIGQQLVALHIVDHDGTVSGVATQGDEAVPLIDPIIVGDRIQWSQRITKPMKMTIRFSLTLDGDELSGWAKPGILPKSAVTGSRRL